VKSAIVILTVYCCILATLIFVLIILTASALDSAEALSDDGLPSACCGVHKLVPVST